MVPFLLFARLPACSRFKSRSIAVDAAQELFDGVRLARQFEHATTDLFGVDGRAGVSVDHHELGSSRNLPDGESPGCHETVESQPLLEILRTRVAALAVE